MGKNTSTQPVESISSELVFLEITTSPLATIAVLSASIGGVEYTWTGTAKTFPGDKFDPEIGRKLAIGRAFASAGRQLERQGNGLVKNKDHNRVASQKARAKREAMKEAGVSVHRVPRRSNRTSS